MADANYIVELILKARDETGTALARAAGNMEALRALEERSKRQTDETTAAFKRQEDAVDSLGRKRLENYRRDTENNRNAINEQVRLENASRDYQKTLSDINSTEAERKQKLEQVTRAQKDLRTALQAEGQEGDKWDKAKAAAFARRVKEINQQIQLQDDLAKSTQTAARQEEQIDRERQRRKKAVADAELDLLKTIERERDNAARDNIRRLDEEDRKEAQSRQRRERAERQAAQARVQQARDEDRLNTQAEAQQRRLLQIEQERTRLAGQRGQQFRPEEREKITAQLDLDEGEARTKLREFQAEAAGRNISLNVDLDAARARVEGEALRKELGRDVHVNVDLDQGASQVESFFTRLDQHFESSSGNIAAFDNVIRGAVTFLIAGFLQPLIVVAGAAAGALAALASSAIFAGGALGGGLVAGIAQALPIIGVLALAVTRIAAIFKVLQQQQLVQQQQSAGQDKQNRQVANSTNQVANAHNSLKNAMDGVGQAHQRVADAQKNLVQSQRDLIAARQQAIAQLQDLYLAERRATLSQENSQKALRAAIATGGDVAGAQLQRDESNLAATRARQNLAGAQAAGVEGSPVVTQAKDRITQAQQNLAQARQGVAQAQAAVEQSRRGLDQAVRGVDAATAGSLASVGKLNFLTQQLSTAEQRTLNAFKRIYDLYNDPKGPIRGITDILMGSFTDLANRIYGILKNPAIMGAFLGLANGIAGSVRRLTDAFLGNEAMRQWLGFIGQATLNLKPLTDIVINLGRVFMNIATAAGPALRLILGWISDVTRQWSIFTGSFRGQNVLTQFFTEGVKHLRAWVDLAGAVAKLFLAIAGPGGGARLGLQLVQGATSGVNNLTKDITNHGKAWVFLQQLWRITRETLKALAPVFRSIAVELGKTFTQQGVQSVRAFGTIMAEVIVPAFGQFIRAVGRAVIIFGDFIKQHPTAAKGLKDILGSLIALGFASKVFGILTGGLSGLIKVGLGVSKAFSWVKDIIRPAEEAGSKIKGLSVFLGDGAEAAGGLRSAFAALGGPIGIIVAIIVSLLQVSGKLDDVWNAIKSSAIGIWNEIKKPLADVYTQIKGLVGAFSDLFRGISRGSGIFAILKPIGTLIANILIPGIKTLYGAFGQMFAGIIRVFGGAIQIVRGFVTLFTDPGKGLGLIAGGVGKIFQGVFNIIIGWFRAILAPLRAIWGGISGVVKGAFNVIKSVFGAIISVIVAPFRFAFGVVRTIFNALSGVFRTAFAIWKAIFGTVATIISAPFRLGIAIASRVIRALIGPVRAVVGTIGNILGDIGHFLANAFRTGVRVARAVFSPIVHFVRGVVDDITGAFSDIGDAVSDAISDIPNIFKAILNGVIDLLNKGIDAINDITPGEIKVLGQVIVPKIPDIPHIPKIGSGGPSSAGRHPVAGRRLATGGAAGAATGAYIGGDPADGDSVPVYVKPGEVIMNEDQQREVGLSRVFGALRNAPIITAGGGFAAGGQAPRSSQTSIHTEANITIDTKQATAQLQAFAKIFTALWQRLWNIIAKVSSDNSTKVLREFTDLRRGAITQVERLTDRVKTEFDDMQQRVLAETKTLAKNVANSFDSVTTTVYTGMKYVVDTTNKGLKGFDAKLVKVSITPPDDRSRKAGGGFVGNQGERGRDVVNTVLGRGEAVLNWAHQKLVDPAMRAMYGFGLAEMFKHTNAFHAGGMGGRMGHAQGGFTGPGHSGEGFTPVWNMARSKFHMTNFTGFDGHSMMTSSGNVSDHFKHMALDMSNGILTPMEDALSAFFKKKVPQVVKQLIWRDHDQFQGFTVPGHQDHVHLAMKPAYAFDKLRTAKILSAAIRGLDFSDLLVSGDGGSGADSIWKDIKRAVVKGKGFLHDLAQKALDKARDGANKYGHKKVDDASSEFTKDAGSISDPIRKHFRGPASTFGPPGEGSGGTAYGRSSADPGIAIDPNPPSGWNNKVAQSLALNWFRVKMGSNQALLQVIDKGPAAGARMIDITGAGAKKMGINPSNFPTDSIADATYAGTHARGGFAGWFAKGGNVPGPMGRAMHAIVHAGEWVLNPRQQAALANAMGSSIGKVRDWLGFTGGPTEFQGGTGGAKPPGDPAKDPSVDPTADPTAKNAATSLKDIIGDFEDILTAALERIGIKGKDAIAKVEKAFDDMTDSAQQSFLASLGVFRALTIAPGSAAGTQESAVRGLAEEEALGVGTNETLLSNLNAMLRGLPRRDGKGKVGKAFKGAQDKVTKSIELLLKNLDELSGDSGIFSLVAQAIEDLSGHLQAGIDLAAQGISRVRQPGTAGKRGGTTLVRGTPSSPVEAAFQQLQAASQVGSALQNERRDQNDALVTINKALALMRQRGLQNTDDYATLIGKRNEFLKTLDDTDAKIAANASAQFDAFKALVEANWAQALKPLATEETRLGSVQHIGEALGMDDLVARANNQTIDNLRQQQSTIFSQLQQANALAAQDPRWQEAADNLAQQYNEVSTKIFDKQIEIFQNQLAAVDKAVGREQAALDRTGRLADVQERFGDRAGAAQARVDLSNARQGELQSAVDRYSALRDQAAAMGNVGAVNDLTDKIEDLKVQIAEQVVTTKELITTQHQLSVDILTGRTQAATGIFGAATSILTSLAELTGAPTIAGQTSVAQQTGQFLRDDQGRIVNTVASNVGFFGGQANGVLSTLLGAFQQGPEAFASALGSQAGAIGEVETQMTEGDKKLFADLVQAMIDNTTQTIDNSKAIKDLTNQTNVQSFSTTAWQLWRQAIFTGTGQIIPEFASIPHMQSGGLAGRDGLYYLHAGEKVTPRSQGDGGTHLHVTNPTEVADGELLARKFAWALSSTPER
jgi:phage-related protein